MPPPAIFLEGKNERAKTLACRFGKMGAAWDPRLGFGDSFRIPGAFVIDVIVAFCRVRRSSLSSCPLLAPSPVVM
jgi:hypothetical protein